MRDKRQSAAALEYSPSKAQSPRVTAQGRGEMAQRIIQEAKRAGVPIREDPTLVDLLLQLDLDQAIPPELYQAVAEILFFIYRLNEQWKREHGIRPAVSLPTGNHR
jgi:flagellar biosynthesis protein